VGDVVRLAGSDDEWRLRVFHGYDDYPELLALSGLTLASIALAPLCLRRARRRRFRRSPINRDKGRKHCV